jgi:hypothetical protein
MISGVGSAGKRFASCRFEQPQKVFHNQVHPALRLPDDWFDGLSLVSASRAKAAGDAAVPIETLFNNLAPMSIRECKRCRIKNVLIFPDMARSCAHSIILDYEWFGVRQRSSATIIAHSRLEPPAG